MSELEPLIQVKNFTELSESSYGFNLGEEIQKGELVLNATSLVRYRFAFVIGDQPVGLFAIQSLGPHKLTMARAWNRSLSSAVDPFTGMVVPTPGKQLARGVPSVSSSPTFFLIEFGQFGQPSRKVAFKATSGRHYECSIERVVDKTLKFEALDLEGIRVLG